MASVAKHSAAPSTLSSCLDSNQARMQAAGLPPPLTCGIGFDSYTASTACRRRSLNSPRSLEGENNAAGVLQGRVECGGAALQATPWDPMLSLGPRNIAQLAQHAARKL